MTAIIILTSAAPVGFLLWLFLRRTRGPSNEEHPERYPAASDTSIAEKISTAVVVIPRPADHPAKDQSLDEREEESCEQGNHRPEKEQPVALKEAAAFAQSQKSESCLSGEAEAAKPIADANTEPSDQRPRAASDEVPAVPSIETFLDSEELAAGNETTVIDGQNLIGKPALTAADITSDITSIAGSDLLAAGVVQETETALVAVQNPGSELTQTIAGDRQAQSQPEEEPVESDAEKTPQRYRPPPQKPPGQTITRHVNEDLKSRRARSRLTLAISIRLTFDRSGFCSIALLPERTSELDTEVAVNFGGTRLLLMAQEDFYQDLQFEKIGDHLRRGVELKGVLADRRRVRWLLTRRDLYVLASHQRASGFVSTNRLALGRSHVVLCTVGLQQQVQVILNEAGCKGYTKLDESHGVPAGWVGLRGVLPSKAIPLDLGSDPFYAIKPAPDIEINLEGGICLRGSAWLEGYPPRIELLGESNGGVNVLIDGKEAQHTPEGFLTVDGYDLPGQHFVYCERLSCSRSYSIEEPPDSWREWPAHHFGQADICGPSVRLAPEAASRQLISVPMSNPLLLGAKPGQIFCCSPRRTARWKGYVPFDVVWALPAHPLLCDKKTARIVQFTTAPVGPPRFHPKPSKPVLAWCNAILDASRKGLRPESDSSDSPARWGEYKKAARKIWRAVR